MKNENEVLTVGVMREMFGEFEGRIEKRFDKKLDEKLLEQDQKFERRLELLEQRLGNTIRKECDRVRQDIIDVIDDNVQPQFTALNARVTRLERKIA